MYLERRKQTNEYQRFIEQHPTMKLFNDTSVNTMRIVTFNTGKRVVMATTALRFGNPGSLADNSDMGGLFTAIHDDGTVANNMFSFIEKKDIQIPMPVQRFLSGMKSKS